jgi:hypothetical protein
VVDRNIPRFHQVALPILRSGLPGVTITTWVADVDHRTFPLVLIRRIGGHRHRTHYNELDIVVIEMTAFSKDGLIEAENLYQDALQVLYDACDAQTVTDYGHIHSVFETMGQTQFSSLYMDSWRSQGLIQLGIRPTRN